MATYSQAQIIQIITDVANQYGVPPALALSVAQQESGFDYTNQSGDGGTSFGLYQLHEGGELGDVPGASTADKIAAAMDPRTNAETAMRVIAAQYKAHPDWSYGQIAAAAQRPGDPSGYAASINAIAAAGKYGQVSAANVSPSGAAINPATATAGPVVNMATVQADFPTIAGLLDSTPELKQWAQNVIAKGINPATSQGQLQAQQLLQQTAWYKKQSDATRKWELLQQTNPAEANAEYGHAQADLAQQARMMGVTLTSGQVQHLAALQLRMGYNAAQLTSIMGSYLKQEDPTKYGGTAAANEGLLQSQAAAYGVPLTTATIQNWVSRIAQGSDTVDGFTNFAKQQAKLIYPGMAAQIDQGQTVKDVATSYIQTQANLLELDPATLDLQKDPLLKQALQYATQPTASKPAAPVRNGANPPVAGGTATAPHAATASTPATTPNVGTMPMYQFEQLVKNDPRWLKTSNARDSALSTVQEIGKSWGFSA